MRTQYAQGIAWGEAKQQVFEHINTALADKRAVYDRYMADPAELDRILKQGAERARAYAVPMMADVRRKVGIGPLA
jgi:tryptophanyl-tRNA synthetase